MVSMNVNHSVGYCYTCAHYYVHVQVCVCIRGIIPGKSPTTCTVHMVVAKLKGQALPGAHLPLLI